MRSSKPPLILMEQMVMVLVFALAAALCLQAFVKSDSISKKSEQRDRALLCAQNAMEVVRDCRGDMHAAAELYGKKDLHSVSDDVFVVNYDADWNLAGGNMRYTLSVVLRDSGVDGLGMAEVWVRDELEDRELVRMDVAWQEPLSVEVEYGTAG